MRAQLFLTDSIMYNKLEHRSYKTFPRSNLRVFHSNVLADLPNPRCTIERFDGLRGLGLVHVLDDLQAALN